MNILKNRKLTWRDLSPRFKETLDRTGFVAFILFMIFGFDGLIEKAFTN